MANLYQYFVEGPCEESFLSAFMHDKSEYMIQPGKITIFNFLLEKFSKARALAIKKGTKVVLVFDTDVNNTKILKENLVILKRYSSLNSEDIIFLQSVKCFEDELVRSASKIASINEVFNTTSVDEFKKKFINCKNIPSKLNSLDFDIKKMWISKLPSVFKEYKNDTSHIIIKRK